MARASTSLNEAGKTGGPSKAYKEAGPRETENAREGAPLDEKSDLHADSGRRRAHPQTPTPSTRQFVSAGFRLRKLLRANRVSRPYPLPSRAEVTRPVPKSGQKQRRTGRLNETPATPPTMSLPRRASGRAQRSASVSAPYKTRVLGGKASGGAAHSVGLWSTGCTPRVRTAREHPRNAAAEIPPSKTRVLMRKARGCDLCGAGLWPTGVHQRCAPHVRPRATRRIRFLPFKRGF